MPCSGAIRPSLAAFSKRALRIGSYPPSYFPRYFAMSSGKACIGQWAAVYAT